MGRTLANLAELDLSQDVVSDDELRRLIPHDHEFKMLDGICHLDLELGVVVGYKDFGEDAWWARGHVPGRPIMPGVLMIEGCAQAAAVLMKKREGWDKEKFIALGGVDKARFRGVVVPPVRIHFASAIGTRGSRMFRYPAQSFVDGKMVMEMELLGVLF
ncbi:MAG: 3-hydroxyacyl-ACP dehydratase FabZ family protein [Planctomycetota bacterium]|jgi:3-hydroxyacyl-[acyl-carrier-protein] dehydratase